MDNLEKFIIQHREEFDVEVPSLKVWAGIDKEMAQKTAKRVRLRKMMSIAASVVVLLIAGAILGIQINEASNEEAITSLSDIAPEYADLEQHYKSQVNQKYQQLVSYNHDVYVEEDLAQLDAIFEELKLEFQNVPKGSEEHIINAMINNYQTKIDILEQVLEKIQSINQTSIPAPAGIPSGDGDTKVVKTESDEISI